MHEYLKNHFITAYYVDNDRKMIEVQCSNDDSSQIIPYVIEQDENHPYFQALLRVPQLIHLNQAQENQRLLPSITIKLVLRVQP